MNIVDQKAPHIVIVGGGITGLSTAYYTQKIFANEGFSAQVTVLESSSRFGGKVETLVREQLVIERGPDSFLTRKLPMIELARDLGMIDQLVPQSSSAKKTYILHKGKLHPIPRGLILGVPTEWQSFVNTGLISPTGKLRAALDLWIPRSLKKEDEDESLGSLLRRRLGNELVDVIVEPLLSGIYAGDADQLSVKATFPQFRAAEQQYGSLIQGMRRGVGWMRPGQTTEVVIPPQLHTSVFSSFRHGLSSLVNELVAELEQLGAALRVDATVQSIQYRPDHTQPFVLRLGEAQSIEADIVLLTVPPPMIGSILPDFAELRLVSEMQYASVANIVFTFTKNRIQHPLDGSGFLVPRKEGRFITACTWTSSKWAHVAPQHQVILRCYVGRNDDERWMNLDDRELVRKVRHDLAELMGIKAQPDDIDIRRLPQSMPQYHVGHPIRVQQLREALKKRMPGCYVAGAGYDGVGLPDCVQQAKQVAQQALQWLKEKEKKIHD
jgi:oxygen-dependent protoporphyrinogen oxidase